MPYCPVERGSSFGRIVSDQFGNQPFEFRQPLLEAGLLNRTQLQVHEGSEAGGRSRMQAACEDVRNQACNRFPDRVGVIKLGKWVEVFAGDVTVFLPADPAQLGGFFRIGVIWGSAVNRVLISTLKQLTTQFGFSIALGDLILLGGQWYVTHTGLIRIARACRCAGINVRPVPEFCDPKNQRWSFRATVYRTRNCRGFVGYGDADPSNVSFLVQGAEMRIAETRAVNRALRKAYGIGVCSIEEIGARPEPESSAEPKKMPSQPANGNGPRTVRDRLCQVIRQHELDPNLVKSYVTEFCGVKVLREATREQVETFVVHLADWAEKDRNALLCQLNSYLCSKEGAA